MEKLISFIIVIGVFSVLIFYMFKMLAAFGWVGIGIGLYLYFIGKASVSRDSYINKARY